MADSDGSHEIFSSYGDKFTMPSFTYGFKRMAGALSLMGTPVLLVGKLTKSEPIG